MFFKWIVDALFGKRCEFRGRGGAVFLIEKYCFVEVIETQIFEITENEIFQIL